MARRGHEVHMICHKKKLIDSSMPSTRYSEVLLLENLGVKVHYIKPEQDYSGGISSSSNIYQAFKMQMGYIVNAIIVGRRIINDRKINMIHANMYTPVIPAAILGKIHHLPVVITLHNPTHWKEWSFQKNIPTYTSILGPIYEKIILRMPIHTIHVVSKKVKDELGQINPKARAVVIHNGVEIQDLMGSKLESEYDNFMLYLGRLVRGKNLEVVILGFKEVVKTFPEAKLIVAGDGPMRQEWQELVNKNNLTKNIVFLGHISDKTTKLELLTKCSAVVFPSTDEGFALVPIEAFEMSKPLLMSNVRPSDEIVDNDVDGFLLPPNDPKKWAEKIVYMLSNPQICERMGSKGREKVESTFNMTTMSNKMEQLYQNVIINFPSD